MTSGIKCRANVRRREFQGCCGVIPQQFLTANSLETPWQLDLSYYHLGWHLRACRWAHFTATVMFSSLGLFANLACPAGLQCLRPSCLYSHRSDLPLPHSLNIPIEKPKATPRPNHVATTIPAKRAATHTPATHFPASSTVAGPSSISSNATEPPRKLQRLGVTEKRVTATSTSYTSVISIVTLSVTSLSAEMIVQLDWSANPQSQCGSIIYCYPSQTGKVSYHIAQPSHLNFLGQPRL